MGRKRALSMLRETVHYRADAFHRGLRVTGFEVVVELHAPGPSDVLLIWNREGMRNTRARQFEAVGARVLVAENGYLGKQWRGSKWFALALGHHCGIGQWPDAGPARWDGLGAELEPWRDGPETLVLAQRGIGEPGIASPDYWAETIAPNVGGRLRRHPGATTPLVSLRDDLAKVGRVVTWSSSAALLALTMGVPVYYGLPGWIGAGAALPLSQFSAGTPRRDDAARLAMFQRLAWAMWTADEVAGGEPFARLLAL